LILAEESELINTVLFYSVKSLCKTLFKTTPFVFDKKAGRFFNN